MSKGIGSQVLFLIILGILTTPFLVGLSTIEFRPNITGEGVEPNKIPETITCSPSYLDEFKCEGNLRYVKFQYSDCTTGWVYYEECDFLCENGICVEKPIEYENCNIKDRKYCEGSYEVIEDYHCRFGYGNDTQCEKGFCYSTKSWNYCSYGCEAGECKIPPQICTPGTTKCKGNWIEKCSIDGTKWEIEEYCSYGCENGECKPKPKCDGTFTGNVTRVIDGDTLEVEFCGKVRLALVDAPEYYETGYEEAKRFTLDLCLQEVALIDQDDLQPYDIYGRIVAVVYCQGKRLNEELLTNNLATVDTRYCSKSEFANENWVRDYCFPTVPEPNPEPTPPECDPSYPDVCIPPYPPDLDCSDIPYRNFRVLPPDPHRFDGDKDGIGCER